MNKYLSILIKSPFVRARILSGVRAAVTAVGAGLVAKGYASESMIELLVGLATASVGFWLGDQDVKTVDKKIEAAIQINPKTVQTKDEIEREITRNLNKNQGKIGKAGW